jgi:lipopolysaccharide biosynthesis glycosyltransferase
MKIVTATDQNYIPGALTLIKSLWYHHYPIEVLICEDGDYQALREIEIPIRYVKIPKQLPEYGHITRTMYCRLMIPQLYPEEDRILYIDADCLVLRTLDYLAGLDMKSKGYPTAAVLDGGAPFIKDQVKGSKSMAPAFNSGVLLMDLDVWRAKKIGEAAISLVLTRPGEMTFPDQSALNYVHDGNFFVLDPIWNSQVHSTGIVESAHIIHYHGPLKPWMGYMKGWEQWKSYEQMQFKKGLG